MQFYKHWIGDYQRDTSDLSLIEHGAYRQLLDTYYANDGNIPADLERLYRIARATTPEEQAAVRHIVERFFPLHAVPHAGSDAGNHANAYAADHAGMMRRNKRADIEMHRRVEFTEQQRGRAKRRWADKNAETHAENHAANHALASSDAGNHAGNHANAYAGNHAGNHASHSHSHSQTIYNNSIPNGAALSLAFDKPHHDSAYRAYRDSSSVPVAVEAVVQGIIDGMATGQAVEPTVVGQALADMLANGEKFNAGRLRGYIRTANDPRPARPAGGTERPRNGRLKWEEYIAKLDAEEAAEKAAAAAAAGLSSTAQATELPNHV